MRHWKIGDIGIICGVPTDLTGHDLNGSVVMVTSPESVSGKIGIEHTRCAAGIADQIWPQYLRPIPDEYDGKQVSTWDEMNDKDYIWQPEKVPIICTN